MNLVKSNWPPVVSALFQISWIVLLGFNAVYNFNSHPVEEQQNLFLAEIRILM